MVYFDPIGVDWPLPVQKEHIILQLSPVAMAKHFSSPQLDSDFSAISTRKYQAIFSHFLEEPSVEKPWHLCELYILHEISPSKVSQEEYNKKHRPAGNGAVPSIADKELAEAIKTTFPPSSLKPTYLLQSVHARIRTRLCELPRAAPNLFMQDSEQWRQLYRTLSRASEYRPDHAFAFECRRCFVKRTVDPATQPVKSSEEQPAPWRKEEQSGVYLLPHFEYSFDLDQPVSLGRFWEEEHAEIVSLLRTVVPSIPERGRIPITWACVPDDEREERVHFVEHPRSESPMTELRNRMYRRQPDSFDPEPRPSMLRRLSSNFSRLLATRVPKPAPPEVAPSATEYVDKVDKPSDSIYVEAPATPREKGVKVIVPASKSEQRPESRSSQSLISGRHKQLPEFIDRPFIPFADSYKVEKKEEKREGTREHYDR
ncbi:uncharacterized protein PHACADRAFT_206859 [Phanerochaete carnosa HHB-10118-sp]|uniref:Uncharacterized protein n=1 Tax=Phanerochaete carnosa (strain HHB-10118-sp) TaxID=650164 RepID=K5X584_PHACS|nr:uncharacterized protein PHACADRAFT_206859 [Phanerochaete carnosa HHB-10118-sp]EKM58017.1 hypothetical protein PHACADRAFT_206859 [Phanerochaete carnosa HHB-10118-sp]